MRLELAADYLVMAAWLAYLKSRLLLPEPPKGEEPSADDLATALALRLRRLEAMREAAPEARRARPARARRFRPRGARAGRDPPRIHYEATLYDLLSAYARQRQKQLNSRVSTARAATSGPSREAREALERLVGPSDRLGRPSTPISCELHGRAVHAADRPGLDLVGDPGNGAGRQAERCARTRPSRRSGCKAVAECPCDGRSRRSMDSDDRDDRLEDAVRDRSTAADRPITAKPCALPRRCCSPRPSR